MRLGAGAGIAYGPGRNETGEKAATNVALMPSE
jgi:hypothetical protein